MSPSGPAPPSTRVAELQQHARRIGVGIGDLERLVRLQVRHIGEPVGRIVDQRQAGRGFCLCSAGRRAVAMPGGGECASSQELTAADIDQFVAAFHAVPPISA